jgi:hypothetical protein
MPRMEAEGYRRPLFRVSSALSIHLILPFAQPLHTNKRRETGIGYPLSMHQIPVPVPMSSILCGWFPIGAKCSCPPQRFTIIACFISSLSILLMLIIWENISSLSKLMVPSPVLEIVVPYIRGYGGGRIATSGRGIAVREKPFVRLDSR